MSQQSHVSPPNQYAPLPEQDRSRPPKKSGAGKMIVGGAVAVAVIGGGVAYVLQGGADKGGSGGDSSVVAESPARGAGQKADLADAKITSCGLTDFSKLPNAEVTITNHSSATSDYQVHIEFLSTNGEHLGQTVANASGLAAGDEAETSAQGAEPLSGKITCKVTEVLRKSG